MAITTKEGQVEDKERVVLGFIGLSVEDIDSKAMDILSQLNELNIIDCEKIIERVKDFLPRYSYVQSVSNQK